MQSHIERITDDPEQALPIDLPHSRKRKARLPRDPRGWLEFRNGKPRLIIYKPLMADLCHDPHRCAVSGRRVARSPCSGHPGGGLLGSGGPRGSRRCCRSDGQLDFAVLSPSYACHLLFAFPLLSFFCSPGHTFYACFRTLAIRKNTSAIIPACKRSATSNGGQRLLGPDSTKKATCRTNRGGAINALAPVVHERHK